jgi:feruloyl esterase
VLDVALAAWVEKNVAPARITASNSTNGKVVRTSPLCPYPQIALYNGVGSTDEASSFECRAPVTTSALGTALLLGVQPCGVNATS